MNGSMNQGTSGIISPRKSEVKITVYRKLDWADKIWNKTIMIFLFGGYFLLLVWYPPHQSIIVFILVNIISIFIITLFSADITFRRIFRPKSYLQFNEVGVTLFQDERKIMFIGWQDIKTTRILSHKTSLLIEINVVKGPESFVFEVSFSFWKRIFLPSINFANEYKLLAEVLSTVRNSKIDLEKIWDQ